MHHRAKDITGLRVGYLTASMYQGSDCKKSLWEVRCDCGNTITMPATELKKQAKRGVIASCGCMRRATIAARQRLHGMSLHPAFAVWRSMIDRCTLPSHQAWRNYGARGITVCARWRESFEAFWADMGPAYTPGLTLERVDNMRGYGPDNCRWATYKDQANNRRNNRVVQTPDGPMTAAQLADKLGVPRSTMYLRLKQSTTSSTVVPVTASSSPPAARR